MLSLRAGDLVDVTDGSSKRDGIVFDLPSDLKVVVAIVDPRRGPGFRTVHPRALTRREQPRTDDPILRRLIRRTPPPAARRSSGGPSGQAVRAAHTRAAGHRTTGK